MKCSIRTDELSAALKRLRGVVAARSTIPILSHVHITAGKGEMMLRATNLDIEAQVTMPAAVDGFVIVCAPHQTLEQFVGKLTKGADVTLEAESNAGTLKVVGGRSRMNLQTLPGDDFPTLDVGDLPVSFVMEAKDLARMFRRVSFAISTEETRYYLNGVYWHTKEAKLRAVATDGHRLAKLEAPLPEGAENMPGIIVPRQTVDVVTSVCETSPGAHVTVRLSASKIHFDFGAFKLMSKLIDGTFPDYERVIPVGNNCIAAVDRVSFSSMVDRIATVGTERTRGVKLRWERGKLTASINDAALGSAVEDMEADYDADDLEIGFNARYLHDLAAAIPEQQLRIELADPASPTVISGVGDEGFMSVLMPMRV